MIKKKGSNYVVTNKEGTKTLGTHPDKAEAMDQLAAIEISKKQRIKRKK